MTQQELQHKVQWKDLRQLNAYEKLIEVSLPYPWLIASLFFAYIELYWLAVPFSAFFFLTGLRQSHNGFHKALGIGKFWTWLSFYTNSLLMVTSIHAVRYNHIRHHQYCLTEKDYEGKAATMTWLGAIIYGPVHSFLIHQITWLEGNKKDRINLVFELLSIIVVIGFVSYYRIDFLVYHLIVMALGECLMPFFAVWAVHRNTSEKPNFARTQRTGWKNRLTYNMFYHLEHHLFPAVPTIKMPQLAKRIDSILPDLDKKETF